MHILDNWLCVINILLPIPDGRRGRSEKWMLDEMTFSCVTSDIPDDKVNQ